MPLYAIKREYINAEQRSNLPAVIEQPKIEEQKIEQAIVVETTKSTEIVETTKSDDIVNDIPQNDKSLVPNKAIRFRKDGRFRLEDNEFVGDDICRMKVGRMAAKDIVQYVKETYGVSVPIGTINAIETSKMWKRRCSYHRNHLSVQINNIPNAHPLARIRALNDIIEHDEVDDKIKILAIHEMELQTQSERMQKLIFDTDDVDSMSHEEKVRIIIPRFIKMVEDVRLPEYLSIDLKKALIACAERIKKYDKMVENKVNMNTEVISEPTKTVDVPVSIPDNNTSSGSMPV